ncbi:MAG: class I SAM-dependent methyltransferase [Candidatus Chisholmbacteria bacterium]|nr:class I SAM-dependent methyltransferase [Candidatus Chisholmbacteria bacterium]
MAKKGLTEKLLRKLRHLPFLTRVHALLRLGSFPFAAILPDIPRRGPIVDYGCGFGLFSFYLVSKFPKRRIISFDPSPKKTVVAQKILKFYPNVTVTQSFKITLEKCPHPQAIVMLDVLYLFPPSQKKQVLAELFTYLKKGGTLILSFVPQESSWRYYLAWFEEWLMVKLFGLTQGQSQTLEFESEGWLVNALKTSGFTPTKLRHLPTPWPFFHRHLLIVARKPKLKG